jgi:dTDP-4-amino-4,6-dideoxygalactose transaminase
MLDRIIERRRRTVAATILAHYREQYLLHAVLLPNARFGLYAAAREMLSPGDPVLISPITCRTVVEALWAAEVRPVFLDIEPASGNIDVSRIPDTLLRSAKAIVTTNLYGNPDGALELSRMARAHGLLLIEDCAHVLGTSIEGRQIGGIGDVSVFSFKKYFGEPGGVVTLRNEDAARRVRARVARETGEPTAHDERARYLQFLLCQITGPSVASAVSSLARPLGTGDAAAARENRRFSKLGPKPMPSTAALLRVAGLLSRRTELISERIDAARKLRAQCPLEPKITPYQANVCPMVVPFGSPRRDQLIGWLREGGIQTYFLYAPPMNRLFGDLAQSHKIDADRIDHWCRTIFPIDLRYTRQALDAIHSFEELT